MSDREALAKRAMAVMWREDATSRWLGMQLQDFAPGRAHLSMRVTHDMVNGQNVCHGGLIFTLADSAFGFACNTHNQRALAASCAIEYLAPEFAEDELHAQAAEVARRGRTGIYDVRVTNQKDELIALFRGKSATVKGTWVD